MVGTRAFVLGLVSLVTLSSVAGIRPAAADPGSGGASAALETAGGGREQALLSRFVRTEGALNERQLAALAAHLSQELGSEAARPVTVLHPFAPVNRLRVLATLVKVGVSADEIDASTGAVSERMPPDAAAIPAWGVRFVAAAVEQGWWPSDRPIQPRQVATWAFVKTVLGRMLDSTETEPTTATDAHPAAGDSGAGSAAPAAGEKYSGLVIDARGLDLQRAMGPRILDEDGQVLYPDPNHVPEMSFLQDHGMAAYVKDGQDTPRSGGHPLVVPATSVTGPGHDDLVVSHETARQIREAEGHSGFLAHWAVSILIGT